jgi:hypothetical protein
MVNIYPCGQVGPKGTPGRRGPGASQKSETAMKMDTKSSQTSAKTPPPTPPSPASQAAPGRLAPRPTTQARTLAGVGGGAGEVLAQASPVDPALRKPALQVPTKR